LLRGTLLRMRARDASNAKQMQLAVRSFSFSLQNLMESAVLDQILQPSYRYLEICLLGGNEWREQELVEGCLHTGKRATLLQKEKPDAARLHPILL
jgi:hypothetical protein